jgi:hypothetical protein
MAKAYANRVWMTTATTGTGTITLGSAKAGYLTFAEAGVADTNTVTYVIVDGNDFEIGTGTYTSSGTTMSRDTVIASKIGGTAGTSKINLSGTAEVFLTISMADVGLLDRAQTWTAVQTLRDPALDGALVEEVFTITDGAAFEIDPSNGTMQSITLTASRTPKATNFANGESIQLRIKDGTAYSITWTDATFGGSGVIWYGGSAPTLDTTDWTVVVLEKQGGQVYGKLIGVVA